MTPLERAKQMTFDRDMQREIVTAIELAVAAEREECAKIAHEHSAWTRAFGAEKACEMIEAAIRSRTEGEGK